jgi:hypothetical protein
MKGYDYAKRRGVEEISWQRFADLSAKLAEMLHSKELEMILGIARAGLFPATAVACALRREFYPVRVTRRFGDRVKYERPVWRVDVPSAVLGKRVALIDEISDSGETLWLWSRGGRLNAAPSVSSPLAWSATRGRTLCRMSPLWSAMP